MTLKFVNESSNVAWNAVAGGLSADFAGLIWVGKCGNPIDAYNDSWPTTKPLYEISIMSGVEPGELASNKLRDADDLRDGYKDYVYIDPISVSFSPSDFRSLILHEILHGTGRINGLASLLARNYFNEHTELSLWQRIAVRRIFEEAVTRKYVEGMAELNPSLIAAGSVSGIDVSIRGGELAAFMDLINKYDKGGILKPEDRNALAAALTEDVPEADEMCNPPPEVSPLNYGAVWDRLYDLFFMAESIRWSPLILDLDGDGVETLGQNFYIQFDHDKNGFAERSGWVGADDGLLVLDRNGNGQIDNGSELFGNNSGSGPGWANGFAALAEFDSNRDGRIDASDSAFASLRVWKDANSNGLTDAGELLTLQVAGVGSMSLALNNSIGLSQQPD
jgi:hypothetical protein